MSDEAKVPTVMNVLRISVERRATRLHRAYLVLLALSLTIAVPFLGLIWLGTKDESLSPIELTLAHASVFLPVFLIWLLYRVILFVAVGKEAFEHSKARCAPPILPAQPRNTGSLLRAYEVLFLGGLIVGTLSLGFVALYENLKPLPSSAPLPIKPEGGITRLNEPTPAAPNSGFILVEDAEGRPPTYDEVRKRVENGAPLTELELSILRRGKSAAQAVEKHK